MRLPTSKLIRFTIAYPLGTFLIGWGFWCFGYQLLYPTQAVRESVAANNAVVVYAPSMFAAAVVCWGSILFLTSRFDIVGGTLILLGSFMAGFAMIFLAYHVGDLGGRIPLRRHLPAMAALIFILALGICSSIAGFVWLRRKRRVA